MKKSNSNRPTSHHSDGESDKILDYLNGKLSEEEKRKFEELLSEDGPESDAIEGFQTISINEAQKIRQRIHKNMHKNLLSQKAKRRQHFKGSPKQLWVYVLVVLLLILVAYLVIKIMD